MPITIHDVRAATNKYILFSSPQRPMADLILDQLEKGAYTIPEAIDLLHDIHQSIRFETITAKFSGNSTTGVFCKCTGTFDTGLTVLTTPVAGGISVDADEELFICITARGPTYSDYFFTRTGLSVDCMYLGAEGIANECAQALSGNLIDCSGP